MLLLLSEWDCSVLIFFCKDRLVLPIPPKLSDKSGDGMCVVFSKTFVELLWLVWFSIFLFIVLLVLLNNSLLGDSIVSVFLFSQQIKLCKYKPPKY